MLGQKARSGLGHVTDPILKGCWATSFNKLFDAQNERISMLLCFSLFCNFQDGDELLRQSILCIDASAARIFSLHTAGRALAVFTAFCSILGSSSPVAGPIVGGCCFRCWSHVSDFKCVTPSHWSANFDLLRSSSVDVLDLRSGRVFWCGVVRSLSSEPACLFQNEPSCAFWVYDNSFFIVFDDSTFWMKNEMRLSDDLIFPRWSYATALANGNFQVQAQQIWQTLSSNCIHWKRIS